MMDQLELESPQDQGRPWNRVLRAGGWLLVVGLVLASALVMFKPKPQNGLALYVRAGERMRHGEPIYQTGDVPFAYPPLFAVPFVPFSLLAPRVQCLVWYLANCAMLLVILQRLERQVRPVLHAGPGMRAVPVWLFWGLVAAMTGRHLLAVFENQSHDLVILLCIMLAVDALGGARDRSAGLLAGLGTALKATPLLFLPVLLAQRRLAAGAVLLLGAAGFTLLPDLLFPANDGVSWTVAWQRTFLTAAEPGTTATSGAWESWNQLNQGLAGTLYRLFTPAEAPWVAPLDVCLVYLNRRTLWVVTLAGQLAVLAGLLWTTRHRLENVAGDERAFLALGQGAAVACATVLLSPMSSKSHFCVLLLPVVFCLADFLYRRRDPIVGGMLGIAFVTGTLTVKDVLGQSLGDRILALGSLTACALALFVATGRVLLQRSQGQVRNQRTTYSILQARVRVFEPSGSSHPESSQTRPRA